MFLLEISHGLGKKRLCSSSVFGSARGSSEGRCFLLCQMVGIKKDFGIFHMAEEMVVMEGLTFEELILLLPVVGLGSTTYIGCL